jgi:hypothetical protein
MQTTYAQNHITSLFAQMADYAPSNYPVKFEKLFATTNKRSLSLVDFVSPDLFGLTDPLALSITYISSQVLITIHWLDRSDGCPVMVSSTLELDMNIPNSKARLYWLMEIIKTHTINRTAYTYNETSTTIDKSEDYAVNVYTRLVKTWMGNRAN